MKCQLCRKHTPDGYALCKAARSQCRYSLLKLIDFLDNEASKCNAPSARLTVRSGNNPKLPWSEAQLLIERERLMHRIDALIYHR